MSKLNKAPGTFARRVWRAPSGKIGICLFVAAVIVGFYGWFNLPAPNCLSAENLERTAFERVLYYWSHGSCRLSDKALLAELDQTIEKPQTNRIAQAALDPILRDWGVKMKIDLIFKNGTHTSVAFANQAKANEAWEKLSKILATGWPATLSTDEGGGGIWLAMLINLGPIALMLVAFIYLSNRQGGKIAGFGKSRARMVKTPGEQDKVTFKDVAGYREVKEDLKEVVEFLTDPKKFVLKAGSKLPRVPRGVLLVGPPGTGKTLLARATAGEANVAFFTISGSDFVEMFVGVGASRVRNMYETAKKNAPCIIFVDEIDAVGRHRGAGLGGGNDEREQTLNQLLVEMDGFDPNAGIVLIAATNRPDVLDPALMRPGRFDRQIQVPNPDMLDREPIWKFYLDQVPTAQDVSAREWARQSPGCSPADIMNLVNEAALMACRTEARQVTNKLLHEARDKVTLGAIRKFSLSEDENRRTADHEGGHLLVGLVAGLDSHLRFTKATITPRGRTLGVAQWSFPRDPIEQSLEFLLKWSAMAMGGRAAEMAASKRACGSYAKVTGGARGDIIMVSQKVKAAIRRDGFGHLLEGFDDLVPMSYDEDSEHPFLGYKQGLGGSDSRLPEEVEKRLHQAESKIVGDSLRTALQILEEHAEAHEEIVKFFLANETITRKDALPIVNKSLKAKGLPEIPMEYPEDKEQSSLS